MKSSSAFLPLRHGVPHRPQQQRPNPLTQLYNYSLFAAVTCSVAYLSAYSLRSSTLTSQQALLLDPSGESSVRNSPEARFDRASDSSPTSAASHSSVSASVSLPPDESSEGLKAYQRTDKGGVIPRHGAVQAAALQMSTAVLDITTSASQLQQTVSPRLLNSSPTESAFKPGAQHSDPSLPNQTPDQYQPDRQVRDEQPASDATCSPPVGVKLPPSPSSSSVPVTTAPEWNPLPNRYLMVSCTNGGSTNRLLCFQTTILAAILLNRTLLIPEVPLCVPRSLGRPVVYSETLDIGYMSRCFGDEPNTEQPGPEAGLQDGSGTGSVEGVQPPRRVIGASELWELRGGGAELVVDKFLCGQVQFSCTLIDGSCGDIPPQIKLSKQEILGEESGNIYDLAPKIAAVTADTPVLALGDLYFTFFKIGDPGCEFFWPSRFFNTQCDLLFRPPQPVLDQAAWFIDEYLGRNYASIHLRRTDFLGHSQVVSGVQYWPLQAVAECAAEKMLHLNLTSLFVSSDVSDEGMGVFEELLRAQAALARARGKALSVVAVRLPKELNLQPAQRATVDKLVAAHAMVTMFTHRSTFSHHIGYLRESLGLASCHDGYVCQDRSREAADIKWQQ